jgi:small redox-active disulfide protein 2
MKIEVLGAECPKCQKLESMVKEAVTKLDLDAEVSHVYNIDEIVERGVMMTPALVVDGNVKLSGKLPSEAELKNILIGTN